jgi:cell wall-associated NlpC family hydrolase
VPGRINGIALGAVGAGGLFAYAGLKGYSIPQTLQAIITGKKPTVQVQTASIDTPTASASPGTVQTVSGTGGTSGIVSAAMKYDGTHNYHFGGPPPIGTVDCSSWVSKVLSDCGLTIPGGSWAVVTKNGTVHGPNTLSYLAWSGAETVSHKAAHAQPGDLVVWQTHMGIAIGNGEMISAQDEELGTGTAKIFIAGEILFVRRVIIGGSRG